MRRTWTEWLTATLVGAWALGLYASTMAPTVSFWDPGERIASAYLLQVMHAPGAPFYLLVARLFSTLAPSHDTVALAVNFLSVIASTGTVILTHLIVVRLVRRWQEDAQGWGTENSLTALMSGVVGALTFSVTDSFWFNAGISEVYALSTFFTALVVWLALKWSKKYRSETREKEGITNIASVSSSRYLVLISFLFGTAIGVHLLSLLAFFFVFLIVFFTAFDREEWTPWERSGHLILAGGVGAGLFLVVYPGIVKGIPKLFKATGSPILSLIVLIASVLIGIYVTHSRGMPKANLAFICVSVVLIGYGSYALVPLRSATEPPIDINDPDNIERLIGYLEREQYGDTPLMVGTTYNDETGRVNPQTGETTLFPRRHSLKASHWRVYQRYDSDLSFFLEYQVGYMYLRYFLWNFAGRASDVQGAPSVTGLPFIDPDETLDSVTKAPSGTVVQPPSETRNVYFGLPLLLGLFGALYHLRQDWRRALCVSVLFFVTGIGIVIYLNQTPMQPRERDYSYVGSFLAFSLWVGIGAGGLIRLALEWGRDRLSGIVRVLPGVATGLISLLVVPGWMVTQNYEDHDRSESFVARDYAYNILSGLEEDAIIFTNGDNDTYPLWYLQAVEGVRRDVRVVNMSLLNTKWYVRQLKNQRSLESDPLPITLSSKRIKNLRPDPSWDPREVQVPVNSSSSRWENYLTGKADSASVERPMTWTLDGRKVSKSRRVFQTSDFVAYNILRTNAENGWERPIYFSTTVAPESRLDLGPYFQHEGQSYRVLPIKHDQTNGRVVPGLTEKRLAQFQFTNLADSAASHGRTARRMADGYRLRFAYVTRRLAQKGHPEKARALLEDFSESISSSVIPGRPATRLSTARAYREVGGKKRFISLMTGLEDKTVRLLSTATNRRSVRYALYLSKRIREVYNNAGAREQLTSFIRRIRDAKVDWQASPSGGRRTPR